MQKMPQRQLNFKMKETLFKAFLISSFANSILFCTFAT